MTIYHGTLPCAGCGTLLNPVQAAFNRAGLCRACTRTSDAALMKNRMVKP